MLLSPSSRSCPDSMPRAFVASGPAFLVATVPTRSRQGAAGTRLSGPVPAASIRSFRTSPDHSVAGCEPASFPPQRPAVWVGSGSAHLLRPAPSGSVSSPPEPGFTVSSHAGSAPSTASRLPSTSPTRAPRASAPPFGPDTDLVPVALPAAAARHLGSFPPHPVRTFTSPVLASPVLGTHGLVPAQSHLLFARKSSPDHVVTREAC